MNTILSEILPVLILLGISFAATTIAVILNIRRKKNLLNSESKDFIDIFVENKKRQLNANIGGISWSEYVALLILSPLALTLISYFLVANKAMCIIFAAIGVFIPELIVRSSISKSQKAFEERYARALRTLSSSLRSGLTIEQAIDEVGRNPFVDTHIRNGFRQIASDIKVGIILEQAFFRFAKESGSPDATDVAAALSMQAKVGGSEAVVVSKIAQDINDRIMMRREIKSLFADTDMLILIMDVVPYLLIMILYVGSPQMLAPFFASTGMLMLLIGIMVFTTIGSFIIHKMAASAKEG